MQKIEYRREVMLGYVPNLAKDTNEDIAKCCVFFWFS